MLDYMILNDMIKTIDIIIEKSSRNYGGRVPPPKIPQKPRSKSREALDRGFLAETLVMCELSKQGVYSVRLPPQFEYDILTNNNQRIEIKSCSLHNYKHRSAWEFQGLNTKITQKGDVRINRNCDFFVLVGFKNEDAPTFFVIPKCVVELQNNITITDKRKNRLISKRDFSLYKDRWDLIINLGR